MRTGGPLVERDRELAAVDALLGELVGDGRSRAVVFVGEPGIGKTSLLDAAAVVAARRGVRVLRTAGAELEHELAFGGVRQLFAPLLRLPRADLDALLDGPAGLARPVLGLGGHVPDALGDPLWGLYWLVANLSENGPVVLAVDDLQWLDVESQRFVAHLVRRLDGLRVAVLAALRPLDGGGTDPFDLGRVGADVVPVEALSEQAVRTVLHQRASTADVGDVRRWHAVTRGNPLLVEAAVHGARHGDLEAPTDARAVVRAAADRAGPGATALLGAVAVFAEGARLADAAQLAGMDQQTAARAADALVEEQVLVARHDRVAFAHPELRRAVYDGLGVFQRRLDHRRAADLLLARAAPVEDVAAHLLVAEPAGAAETVDVLRAVADEARQRGGLRAACRYLERALAEPPPERERFTLAWELGRAQAHVGDPSAAETLRSALQHAPSASAAVDVAVDLGAVLFATMRYDDAAAVLLRARGRLGPADDERRLLVDAILATAAWESRDAAHLYVEIADQLPRDVRGDTPGERLALAVLGARMFDRCERHEVVREVLLRAIGGETAGPTVCGADLGDPVSLLIGCGALDDAAALCGARQDEARRQGRDALYAAAQVGLARVALLRGELPQAEGIVRLALDLSGIHDVDRAMLLHLLASVRIAQGRLDEAEQALAASGVAGAPPSSSLTLRRAQICLLRGDPRGAVDAFECVRAVLGARQAQNPVEQLWLRQYATALAAVGRRDEAVDVAQELLERSLRFGAPQPVGLAHLGVGLLTTGAESLTSLAEAVRVLDPSPYRLDAAAANVELGSALRRAGARIESRRHLAQALSLAQRVGAEPLARRADEELRASGARPRRRSLSGPAALTPSEERVARLAATGLTNAQVASQLFLTVKTVEMHMSRVLRKLGVTSRQDVAAALAAPADAPTAARAV